ncbi:DUF1120 domain-containing protein [Serratia ureilytica]|uniref:DUF1120 domain-containing protein n=1 Tax=Serratia ureilytica TaxID=300181 RepID=UPI0018A6EC5A|nr:DUF1120 domain-containing protein [Serratia ureilytica]MBF4185541.1 DUF1120 domain-containing protein [Serratia ureilytica]MBF8442441.1 DUF1120 domain-containing protein [Serratia ureilytica]MBF8447324.1 DUF1120 domain-containing protein [Serratia ureilytica]
MMNAVKKTACALAVLATSTAVMAESIDVKVIGTITPTACKPTLTGGGTIDYGTINPNTLKKDEFTILAEKQIDFSITCDAPAKVAIAAKSGRGESAVNIKDGKLTVISTENTLFGHPSIAAAGLGLDGTKGVGGYGLRLQAGTMQADGKNVDSIQSNGNTTSWAKTELGSLFNSTSQRYASWAATGTLTPIAFTTLSGKLGAQAYINKASELDLTKPVKLDGLTTLELVYL